MHIINASSLPWCRATLQIPEQNFARKIVEDGKSERLVRGKFFDSGEVCIKGTRHRIRLLEP